MSRECLVTFCVTPDEHLILDELRQRAHLVSDADTVRLGLWHLAKHYGVDHDRFVFASRGRAQRFRQPKVRTSDDT